MKIHDALGLFGVSLIIAAGIGAIREIMLSSLQVVFVIAVIGLIIIMFAVMFEHKDNAV